MAGWMSDGHQEGGVWPEDVKGGVEGCVFGVVAAGKYGQPGIGDLAVTGEAQDLLRRLFLHGLEISEA